MVLDTYGGGFEADIVSSCRKVLAGSGLLSARVVSGGATWVMAYRGEVVAPKEHNFNLIGVNDFFKLPRHLVCGGGGSQPSSVLSFLVYSRSFGGV